MKKEQWINPLQFPNWRAYHKKWISENMTIASYQKMSKEARHKLAIKSHNFWTIHQGGVSLLYGMLQKWKPIPKMTLEERATVLKNIYLATRDEKHEEKMFNIWCHYAERGKRTKTVMPQKVSQSKQNYYLWKQAIERRHCRCY